MRVACHKITDFLTNLRGETGEHVLNGVVYLSTTKNPVGDDQRNAVKWRVDFQASAVIQLADGGEYLLDAGEFCGVDYTDASQEFAGSEKADELRGMVEQACQELGLSIRPGIVGV